MKIEAYYVSISQRSYVPYMHGRAFGGITRKNKPTPSEIRDLRSHVAKQYNLSPINVVVDIEPTKCSEAYCIGGTLVEAYESLAA